MKDLKKNLEIISWIKNELTKKKAKLISLMISGSHLYGFESEDSDVDYRGTFLINTNSFLGLGQPKDVIELKKDDNDIVLFELKKEIGLALSGNCNVLEHLTAKQIITTKEYLKLRQLIMNAFGKNGLYNSYKGMATFNYKKFILQGKNTVKKYLYVFRGLMAGIHVLQTGVIEPNIKILNQYFKFPEVKKLILLKKSGKEKDAVPADLDTGALEKRINYLFDKIDEAYVNTRLPEKATREDVEKINQFLISVRKEHLA